MNATSRAALKAARFLTGAVLAVAGLSVAIMCGVLLLVCIVSPSFIEEAFGPLVWGIFGGLAAFICGRILYDWNKF